MYAATATKKVTCDM